MKKVALLVLMFLTTTIITGCSAGMIRAFNDALGSANGETASYQNSYDYEYVGGVKWEHGVKNNYWYDKFYNGNETECRVFLTYENGEESTIYLDPGERDSRTSSVYNISENVKVQCRN